MTSRAVIVLMIVIAAVAAVPAPAPAGPNWPAAIWGLESWGAPGTNPYIPPWVAAAPWFPQWTPCKAIGSACVDCTTKLVCTKVGGVQRICTDPKLPYCNDGKCSATPSAECAVPAKKA